MKIVVAEKVSASAVNVLREEKRGATKIILLNGKA